MSMLAISQDPTSTALLTYSALVTPDPFQVNASGTITLVVSNSTHHAVTCTSITVTLPVGTTAKDLIGTAGLQTDVPGDWQAGPSTSGIVMFTPLPPNAGLITRDGVSFTIAALAVNGQVGTSTVTITENASSPSQPAAQRTATLSVPKFPTVFSLTDLQADPSHVTPGNSTVLQWIGSPPNPDGVTGPTYTIQYQPGDDQSTAVSQAVSCVGPYTTENLTYDGSVDFTLIAEMSVPGLDHSLIVQRHTSVTVENVSVNFGVSPTFVGANGLVHLSWTTANAVSCTLEPNYGSVSTNGDLYVIVPATQTFTFTAYDATGNSQEQQRTVTVEATILPNMPGHQIIGPAGSAGTGSNDFTGSITTDGGAGGDAVLVVTLPPIDTSSAPVHVMPITLTGGNGGNGGNGSPGTVYKIFPGRWEGPPGAGGNGGAGGNATLNATFDPSAVAPAQYIITMSGGQGGSAGGGVPGSPGATGLVTMTFSGNPNFEGDL